MPESSKPADGARKSHRVGKVRKKQWKPKVKTGCLTCRIRRLKCDEGKPFCNRCTSTGRTCDGYASPTHSNHTAGKEAAQVRSTRHNRLTVEVIPQVMSPTLGPSVWDEHPDEAKGFYFFTTITAKEMFFDTFPMTQIMLSLSHQEPILRHALVALGAMHKSYLTSKPRRIKVLDSNGSWNSTSWRWDSPHFGEQKEIPDPQLRYALLQRYYSIDHIRKLIPTASRSISKNRSKQSSQADDDDDGEDGHAQQRLETTPQQNQYINNAIALAASLLYACFALLQGHLAEVLFHLEHGCRLIGELESIIAPSAQKPAALQQTANPMFSAAKLLATHVTPVIRRIVAHIQVMPRVGTRYPGIEYTSGTKKQAAQSYSALESILECTGSFLISLGTFCLLMESRMGLKSEPLPTSPPAQSLIDDDPNQEAGQNAVHSRYRDTIRKLDYLEGRLNNLRDLVIAQGKKIGQDFERAFATLDMEKALALGVLGVYESEDAAYYGGSWSPSDQQFHNLVEKAMELLGANPVDVEKFISTLDSDFPDQIRSIPQGEVQEVHQSDMDAPERPKSYLPTFSPITAIVPKLFAVAHHCRNPYIRRKAVALLLQYQRRDGLWDSQFAGAAALEIIRLEEEAVHSPVGINEDNQGAFSSSFQGSVKKNGSSSWGFSTSMNKGARVHDVNMKYLGPQTALVSFRMVPHHSNDVKSVERIITW